MIRAALVLGFGGPLLVSGSLLLGQTSQVQPIPPPAERVSVPLWVQQAPPRRDPKPAAKGAEKIPPPQNEGDSREGNSRGDREADATRAVTDIQRALGPLVPISLPVALRLAATTNLDIAQAREFVVLAEAALRQAQLGFLPDFNIGSTYVYHQGMIQNTAGNVQKTNRDSLFVGGGPSVNFAIADVIFLPLAAQQALVAAQAGLQRVNNDTLLAVADAYLALIRLRRRLARIDATLDFLVSKRGSALRSGSKGMLTVLIDFFEVGGEEALKSEVERARVEVLRRQEERAATLQDFRVASAELARLIRLDPAVTLWPVEDFRRAIPIPGEEWLSQPLDTLAAVALNNRPEIAENQALVRAAVERVRNAKYRPFLPNLVLNYNWGDFGGGPDLNPPIVRLGPPVTVTAQAGFGPSGTINHFNTRSDFDVTLVWRFRNLGFGNLYDLRQRQAEYRRTELRRMQVQDLVLTQVVQAYDLVQGWRQRVRITYDSLFDREGRPEGPVFESMKLNFDRVFNQPPPRVTRPLELLDSIRSLSDLLETYGNDLTDYERARIRLLVSLGMPAQSLWDPRAMPQPEKGECAPAPTAAPPGGTLPAPRPARTPLNGNT
jgi:outer membrane protein TolC